MLMDRLARYGFVGRRAAVSSHRPFGIAAGWRTAALWCARSRQRRALAGLDDRLLKDIGVSRAAAAREAAKPFWR